MDGGQTGGGQPSASDWHQWVTTLVGIASVLLVAVGLFYTNAANRAQQQLTEQGQITDRFGRAIDQLGSDKLDVRLGGVYALERLMRDSRADEPNIIEVLSAYVRDHTHASAAAGSHPTTSASTPPHFPTDVQAALTVLGRRPDPTLHHGVDLTDADLTGVHLDGVNLSGANLVGTDLTGAWLGNADLTGAHLTGANLTRTILQAADLRSAELAKTRLRGAYLYATALNQADLTGADLTGADLSGAILSGAILSGADLTGAQLDPEAMDLTGTDLTGAKWPSDTAVPQGWARDPDSSLLDRASPGVSKSP